jgi:hypothetical protein
MPESIVQNKSQRCGMVDADNGKRRKPLERHSVRSLVSLFCPLYHRESQQHFWISH